MLGRGIQICERTWQELMPLEKIKKSDDDNAAAGGDADS